jgi:F-type H+-transporting ATPase subunit b
MSAVNLAQEAPKESENYLLPNGTFIVETIIFLVVLWIFFRFIVPPIRQALADRDEMVRKSAEDARAAEEKFRLAEERYQQALAEARTEATNIRDTSRAEGQKILDEFRSRTSAEVAELRQRAAEELAAERDRVMGELEPKVRELGSALAGRIVGEDVTVAAAPKRGRKK